MSSDRQRHLVLIFKWLILWSLDDSQCCYFYNSKITSITTITHWSRLCCSGKLNNTDTEENAVCEREVYLKKVCYESLFCCFWRLCPWVGESFHCCVTWLHFCRRRRRREKDGPRDHIFLSTGKSTQRGRVLFFCKRFEKWRSRLSRLNSSCCLYVYFLRNNNNNNNVQSILRLTITHSSKPVVNSFAHIP